jgi:hypothetical protein
MTLISWNGNPIFRDGQVGTEQECCCGCSEECCRERTYSYMDTEPPGKWYDECPEVGNCASGSGAIEGDCAGDVLEGYIVERFCKASVEGLEIRAILRSGSALDDFGEVAGIATDERCGLLGVISGDHDITAELEFEDDGAYLRAKVPFRAENSQLGGPYGVARVVICWCCVDPADPPPTGEVCPCCAGPPPPPPPFCEPCGTADDLSASTTASNERTDTCRSGTYSDSVTTCDKAGFSYTRSGSYIRSIYPDLGIDEEYDDCDILWLVAYCTTTDFANGQDDNENCCTVSRATTVYRNHFYRWVADECLWRLLAQNKEVVTDEFGDPLAVGGCSATMPAVRECSSTCEQTQLADSCCNPFP